MLAEGWGGGYPIPRTARKHNLVVVPKAVSLKAEVKSRPLFRIYLLKGKERRIVRKHSRDSSVRKIFFIRSILSILG
jgi:hypothetical protein